MGKTAGCPALTGPGPPPYFLSWTPGDELSSLGPLRICVSVYLCHSKLHKTPTFQMWKQSVNLFASAKNCGISDLPTSSATSHVLEGQWTGRLYLQEFISYCNFLNCFFPFSDSEYFSVLSSTTNVFYKMILTIADKDV